MPLPKPPARRASLLSPADFEAQAAPRPVKRSLKTHSDTEPAAPPVMDLLDPRAEAAVARITPAPIYALFRGGGLFNLSGLEPNQVNGCN